MATQTGTLALRGWISNVTQRTGFPVPPPPAKIIQQYQHWTPTKGYRVIAQSIRSGEFVDWDVPLSDVEITDTLSGPSTLTGTLTPENPAVNLTAFDAWSTWLHIEDANGLIQASGILQPVSLDGVTLTIDAASHSEYAHGTPFLGTYEVIQGDPLDVIRLIWAHIQSYAAGDLGVTLDATTSPVKIGTEPQDVNFTTGSGEAVSFSTSDGPYQLNWWDHKDCGDEINNLAKSTPFDYRDTCAWNADRTGVDHHIELGYPRLGRALTNQRFEQGVNVTNPIPVAELDDAYASDVIALGAGDGSAMIRGTAGTDPGTRLRRVAVVSDTSMTTVAVANGSAQAELIRRAAKVSFSKITVDTTHPAAEWGSYNVGDDIPVTGEFPWIGQATILHRITGRTWSLDSPLADLTLVPSASVNYAGGATQ